jgi:hypothetical protein
MEKELSKEDKAIIKEKLIRGAKQIESYPYIFICDNCKEVIAHHDNSISLTYNNNPINNFDNIQNHKCGNKIKMVNKDKTYRSFKGYQKDYRVPKNE